MYISLSKIESLFSEYVTRIDASDRNNYSLIGWLKSSTLNDDCSVHQLYVCHHGEPVKIEAVTKPLHVLCVTASPAEFIDAKNAFPQNVHLLLIACTDSIVIYDRLQTFFNTQMAISMFGQTLLQYLSDKRELQYGIDQAFRVFNNPIFIIDMNFNLIAATWEALRQLQISDNFIQRRQLDDSNQELISSNHHIHNKMMKSSTPITIFNEKLGYEQMFCSIHPQKNLGHIVISAVNRPFEPLDSELILVFRDYVEQQFSLEFTSGFSKDHDYEYFLKNILDGKISRAATGTVYSQSMITKFSGHSYCLVIDLSKSDIPRGGFYIRNLFERQFPSARVLIYYGYIVAIFTYPPNTFIAKTTIESIRNLCIDNHLYAGLSNCLQDIFSLPDYYQQALRTIALGATEQKQSTLFCYHDYYLTDIKKVFTDSHSAVTFCHPKMRLLLDYDQKNKSNLAYTFYMYLTHERNISSTAEAMFLHRSTLIYRFKKIEALLENDTFDEYHERMYMILSYEMNHPNP